MTSSIKSSVIKVNLSEEQKRAVATAVAEGGTITVGRISGMYSGNPGDSIEKLINNNFLYRNKKDPIGHLRVPIKDVDENGNIEFNVSKEIVEMAKKIQEREDLREQDEEARRKLERQREQRQNTEKSKETGENTPK